MTTKHEFSGVEGDILKISYLERDNTLVRIQDDRGGFIQLYMTELQHIMDKVQRSKEDK